MSLQICSIFIQQILPTIEVSCKSLDLVVLGVPAQQLESGQHDAIARPMILFMHSAPYLKSIPLLCEATGPLNPPVVYGVGDPFHDEGLELLCNCPSADTTALLRLESGFCDRGSGSFGDL